LLPVFYSDNYVSVLPGEHKTITLNYDAGKIKNTPVVSVSGWNLKEQTINIK
jgi:mannosylglycoprotein endo-beta-mannosidase